MKHAHSFESRKALSFRAALAVFALGVVASASALTLEFKIKNNSGVTVNDVHLLISGTGGSVANRVVVQPGNGVIQASAGNEFNAKFDPLLDGGFLIGRFTVDPGDIVLDSGNWTLDDVPKGDINTAGGIKVGGSGGDVEYFKAVPEPASMMALGLGAFALLRKRRRAA